jgi:hypothetical protein
MKLVGLPERIELKPETEEEKSACRRIINGDAVLYWGDSEFTGGALIINSATFPSGEASLPGVTEGA